ncbi:hypothetical protein NHX12_029731 [Muraenolepis orangiensis]|uniref:Uncharacterized protein n=1 Tax=Muraenolepis orangiensis TaxID=630683 RepID=A0A9Q0EAR4_9TELE|nr:hypothetical protein NHX12_029731 [Muraenolepis orangiensis]
MEMERTGSQTGSSALQREVFSSDLGHVDGRGRGRVGRGWMIVQRGRLIVYSMELSEACQPCLGEDVHGITMAIIFQPPLTECFRTLLGLKVSPPVNSKREGEESMLGDGGAALPVPHRTHR